MMGYSQMESLKWLLTAAHELNPANLVNLQSVDVKLSVIYMALYILALIVKATAARAKASAAVFLCVGLSYSPLYYMLNEVQYYALLSIIYSVTANSISNKKAKAACSIMALFELFMVIDSGVAGGYETWLSNNYETITTLIHCIILSAFVRWDVAIWRDNLEGFVSSLRDVLRGASNKAFVWYYYNNYKNQ